MIEAYVGNPKLHDFYITSQAELDPTHPKRQTENNIPLRTRFYHYEGRYAEKLKNNRYVPGMPQVKLIEGERFSVPFSDMKLVKKEINKILAGLASIRSIQRQSMNKANINHKTQFIRWKLKEAPKP